MIKFDILLLVAHHSVSLSGVSRWEGCVDLGLVQLYHINDTVSIVFEMISPFFLESYCRCARTQ